LSWWEKNRGSVFYTHTEVRAWNPHLLFAGRASDGIGGLHAEIPVFPPFESIPDVDKAFLLV